MVYDEQGYARNWTTWVAMLAIIALVAILWYGPGQDPANVQARQQVAQQAALAKPVEPCGGVSASKIASWESRALTQHEQVYKEITDAVIPPGTNVDGMGFFEKFGLVTCPSEIMWQIDARVGYVYPK